jgi:poly(3-hydroxyalkanoate) synthetase
MTSVYVCVVAFLCDITLQREATESDYLAVYLNERVIEIKKQTSRYSIMN